MYTSLILIFLLQITLISSSWDVHNNTCKGLWPNETLSLKGCSIKFDSHGYMHSACEMYSYTEHHSFTLGFWKDVFLLNAGLVSEEPVYNLSVPTCLYLTNFTISKSRKSINYNNYNNHFTLLYLLKDDFVEIEELYVPIKFRKKRAYAIARDFGNCTIPPNRYKQNDRHQDCDIGIQAISEVLLSKYWFEIFSDNFTIQENLRRVLNEIFFMDEAIINPFKLDFAPSVESPEVFLKFISFYNVTTIDFSRNHFEKIVKDQFPGFSSVIELDLSRGPLEHMGSDVLEGFSHLYKLNLSYNKLQSVPKTISILSVLQILDISYNNISNSHNLKIPIISNLTELILRGNDLVNLKSYSFVSYPKMQYIDLAQCSLVKLSSDLFNNSKYLKYLDLSENYLSSLPRNIFESTILLEELNLAKNRFLSFPVHHLQPTSILMKLDMSDNFLTNISGIGNVSVTNLYLTHNNIREWESVIVFSKLKILDLRKNQIAIVTKSMANSFLGIRVKLSKNPFDCSPCSINMFYNWYIKAETNSTDFVCSSPSSDREKLVLSFSNEDNCSKSHPIMNNKFFIIGCVLFAIGILCIIMSAVSSYVIIFRKNRKAKYLITQENE